MCAPGTSAGNTPSGHRVAALLGLEPLSVLGRTEALLFESYSGHELSPLQTASFLVLSAVAEARAATITHMSQGRRRAGSRRTDRKRVVGIPTQGRLAPEPI